MNSFASDLSSIKRNARLRGRNVSKNEVAGVAEGRARTANTRLVSAKNIELQQEGIGVQREGIASRERMQGESMDLQRTLQARSLAQQKELSQKQIENQQFLQGRSLEQQKELGMKDLGLKEARLEKEDEWKKTDWDHELELWEKEFAQRQYETEVEKQSAKKARRACIIITACTSPTAYEVKVARVFRDECLDDITLGGYYALCEVVVPFIDKFKIFRKLAKKYLVDSFIDYAEKLYQQKRTMDKTYSQPITLCFLEGCRLIGRFVDTKKWIKLHKD